MKEKLRKLFKNAKIFKIVILLLFAAVFIFLGNSKIAAFIIGLMIGYFLVYGIENISNKLFEENEPKVFDDEQELIKLRNDLETVKWMGSDEGWDLAIDKVKERIDEILRNYHYKDFMKNVDKCDTGSGL
jgi:hypothetical protein